MRGETDRIAGTLSIAAESCPVKLAHCLLASLLVIAAHLAETVPARTEVRWMSEEALLAELVGKPLRGYYHDHVAWGATFHTGGQYEYRGLRGSAPGTWYF